MFSCIRSSSFRISKFRSRGADVYNKCGMTTCLTKTPLYEFHVNNSAKIIDFTGFYMPLQYNAQSIIDSHLFVRDSCGLFDVSHMLQMKVHGHGRFRFMESLTVADISGMKDGRGTLSVYLTDNGGILDDLIVNKCDDDYLYIVSNAACASKITNHIEKKSSGWKDINVERIGNALLALQGPKAQSVLRQGIDSIDQSKFDNLYFMETTRLTSLFGFKHESQDIRLTRCGYTGEDGYEINLPRTLAIPVAEALSNNNAVKPIGLAARDTLRLEAGLCLYGNDLCEDTTPVEASLNWLIAKRRRLPETEPRFPGYSTIMDQLKNSKLLQRKRIGLVNESGPPARHGAKIFDQTGQHEIGFVTSGCRSPSLNKNIAMAYCKPEFTKSGTSLNVSIRNKLYPFVVTQMPFVPTRYVRRPAE